MYSEYLFGIVKPCSSVFFLVFNKKNPLLFSFPRIHSWGDSLEEAFEQCAMGMFGYMTDTETVEPIDTVEVESEGESLSPRFQPTPVVPTFYLSQSGCLQSRSAKVCVYVFVPKR